MLKSLLAVSLLAISTSVMARSVDWTPYLKGMQNGCNFDSNEFYQAMGYAIKYDPEYDHYFIEEGKPQKAKIPKALQSSIISYKSAENKESDSITISLKNATAFGQPITKIKKSSKSIDGGRGVTQLTVYFVNNNFIQLKPQFPLMLDNKEYPIGSNAYYQVVQFGDYDEINERYQLQVKKITKAQMNKIEREGATENTVEIAKTHHNGWESSGMGTIAITSLTFDTKNKTIECERHS